MPTHAPAKPALFLMAFKYMENWFVVDLVNSLICPRFQFRSDRSQCHREQPLSQAATIIKWTLIVKRLCAAPSSSISTR
jgi:hypothetical protein